MSLCFRLCLAAGFFFVASFAAATNNNYPEGFARPDLEYRRLAKPSDVIGALGNDLFGEQVDNYSGQTSFSVTDIAIPGNSKLQVALVRSNSIQEPDGYASAQKIGDWDIEVPMLEGIFANNSGGWISDGANPNARCSQGTGVPPTITTPAGGSFLPQDYWQGVKLMIPGMPGQDLLRSNANTQNRSAPARWTTKNNWLIECLPTLKNGVAGEGFVAISPDGTKYFFDHLYSKPSNAFRTRIVQTLYSYESGYGAYVCDGFTRVVSNDYEMLNAVDGAGGGGTGGSCHLDGGTSTSTIKAILYRSSYYLVATRVEDRFGNWVSYTYDANNRLSAIGSNDGRSIQLNYGSTHQFPISATANGRTWSYTYDANKLTRVTQPDGKFWNYAQSGILAPGLLPSVTDPDAHAEPCYDYALFGIGTSAQTEPVFTYVVTHPSGAQGEFKFIPRMQGKSNAISCDVLAVVELSLGSKKITGAGLPSSTWSFVYGPENSSTKTKLTNPNGSQVGLYNHSQHRNC